MSDREEKLKRAKDLAARKALEVYGSELKRACEELGIEPATLAGDAHVHVALMVSSTGGMVAVRSQWTFHDHPAIIGELLERAKKDGSA